MNKALLDTCVLCGLPVEIEGFTLDTEQELKKFCCAGCLCMYQLLHEQPNETEHHITNPLNHEET